MSTCAGPLIAPSVGGDVPAAEVGVVDVALLVTGGAAVVAAATVVGPANVVATLVVDAVTVVATIVVPGTVVVVAGVFGGSELHPANAAVLTTLSTATTTDLRMTRGYGDGPRKLDAVFSIRVDPHDQARFSVLREHFPFAFDARPGRHV